MQAAGGSKDTRRFATQCAAEPAGRGLINEMFERRRHIAEVGRAAHDQAACVTEVVKLHIGCSLGGHLRGAGRSVSADSWHSSFNRLAVSDAFDTPGNLSGHHFNIAATRVVEDKDVVQLSVSVCVVRLRLIQGSKCRPVQFAERPGSL